MAKRTKVEIAQHAISEILYKVDRVCVLKSNPLKVKIIFESSRELVITGKIAADIAKGI